MCKYYRNNTAKQTELKGGKMTEKEYDDIEAKMLLMFGDESKENKPNESVRRSSRSRKKISHYKDEQKAAIVHKVEKKYKTFSNEYYELDSEDLGNESLSNRASSSFGKVHVFLEGHRILPNLNLTFVLGGIQQLRGPILTQF